eukprot:1569529-Pleurochrysis_carterae.AAC.1
MGALVSLATAPLSMLGTCAGSLAGSCFAGLTCKACTCACILPSKLASMLYLFTVSLFVIMALLFEYEGGDIVIGGKTNQTEESIISQIQHAAMHSASSGAQSFWNDKFWCASQHPGGWVICCEDVCGGVYSVYRFSFALTAFFALLALLTAITSRFAASAHRGFWIGKLNESYRPPKGCEDGTGLRVSKHGHVYEGCIGFATLKERIRLPLPLQMLP